MVIQALKIAEFYFIVSYLNQKSLCNFLQYVLFIETYIGLIYVTMYFSIFTHALKLLVSS